MPDRKGDLIRLLEAELDFIEGGGYGRPPRQPMLERPMFYQSLVCIQHWLIPGRKPGCHEDCVLMDFVPAEFKSEGLPCHFIPLNDAGDTVNSLEGNQDRLEGAVKSWLRSTIARLKKEGTADGGPSDIAY